MPPQRHQGAPRRVKRAPPPDHEPCVLPIHQSASGELRALHAKYPPQNLNRWIKDATESLREASSKFAETRREKVFEQDKDRDEEMEQDIAELGVRVERNIRGLVDMDEQLKKMKFILQGISDAEKNRGNGNGIQPVEEFWRQAKRADRAYKRRHLKDRYGNSAEYIELRSLVHGLARPTAPQPQRKDWFKTPMFVCDGRAQISDEEPVSESEGEGRPSDDRDIEMADEESDDGIEEMSATRNLMCPLTMALFKDPVKASCGHIFEKEALLDLFQNYKRLKKENICPTPGCGKQINAKDLRPDALTKRLAEAKLKEKERAEQRAVIAGAGNDESEDEEEEAVSSKSKTERPKSRPRAIIEEEIPFGGGRNNEQGSEGDEDEERVPDSHDEAGEEDDDDDDDEIKEE
ncbi:hypothetical protein TWF730_005200 [Orbilia blumenaviensis]|uniref:SP-RING-type domain-containing protein n=1 Tax=Orbilia blumenaviensis TaxID=1796055 RepID=A0AAV9VJV9_9PEZI